MDEDDLYICQMDNPPTSRLRKEGFVAMLLFHFLDLNARVCLVRQTFGVMDNRDSSCECHL